MTMPFYEYIHEKTGRVISLLQPLDKAKAPKGFRRVFSAIPHNKIPLQTGK